MTTTSATTDAVATARALAPTLRTFSDQIDRERKLPAEAVKLLRDANLFGVVVPEAMGGLDLDPVAAGRVVEEVAAADGSAGWCIMIASQNAMLAGFLPEVDAHEVLDNRQIVCGTARPTGRAVITNDPAPGYRVSGRWPFASGSSHADWFVAECTVYEGDAPKLDPQGNALTRVTVVPRASVTIHDTWHTTGLRGTASNDFSCENVFVPASRGFQMLVDPPVSKSPVYQAFPLVFINHGTHSLGIARSAIEATVETAKSKAGWGGVIIREVPRIQALVAEATVIHAAASEYLYKVAGDLWAEVLAGRPDNAPLRARVRLANSHAATASTHAVDLLHRALGTTSIFTTSPLERHFRDIHTAAAHVMIGAMTYEAAGRVELGLDAQFPFF
jgi:alkylation response protein AidB-like acyl-CoA dehydrogenase